ncbi:hypothetical protein GY45DRAFT_1341631, partial [Cubamyces sp. BRFM 1775]
SWIHTPSGSPPPRAPLHPSPLGLATLPPSARVHATSHAANSRPIQDAPIASTGVNSEDSAASYYAQTTVESFSFSRQIMVFVAARDLTVRQCARIALALDYHAEDWEVLFCEAGLDEPSATELRGIIFEDVPVAMRALMEVVRPFLAASLGGEGTYEDLSETLSSLTFTDTESYVK